MKVLIQGHCSMKTQMAYFKTHFPDWDVRAVTIAQAKTWVEEGHEAFLGFVDEAEIFFGLTRNVPLAGRVPAAVRRINVEPVMYRGWQPDAMWVPGLTPSVLKLGVIQSRIAAQGWIDEASEAETVARFTADTYARLGYFDARARYRAEVEARFLAHSGFGVADLIDGWEAEFGGNFCYLPNHPRNVVFYDIAHRAMEVAGLAGPVTAEALAAERAEVEDYLEEGMHWPVYPEIAAHHGVAAFPTRWRLSSGKDEGTAFGVPQLVARSYRLFEANDQARRLLTKSLTAAEVQDQAAID